MRITIELNENSEPKLSCDNGDIDELQIAEIVLGLIKDTRNRLRTRKYSSMMHQLLSNGEWVIVENLKDIRNSGHCVYLGTASKMPGMLKIGSTKNLNARRKLYSHDGSGHFEVWAFIKCQTPDEAELLEKCILAFLSKSIMHGNEWVEIGAGLDFFFKFCCAEK